MIGRGPSVPRGTSTSPTAPRRRAGGPATARTRRAGVAAPCSRGGVTMGDLELNPKRHLERDFATCPLERFRQSREQRETPPGQRHRFVVREYAGGVLGRNPIMLGGRFRIARRFE